MKKNLPKPLVSQTHLPQAGSSPDVSLYSSWPEIFRSWFWRFYDHLFQLILYNFGWVFSCVGIAWLANYFGWIEMSRQVTLARVYGLYLVESSASIGWAYLVFKIFISGDGKLVDIWVGIRKYFLKAIGVSAISGFLIGLAFYNVQFYYFLNNSNRFLNLLLTVFILWILIFLLSVSLNLWPILFFQNPPFFKIFYKSCLLALGNGLVSLGILLFFTVCSFFFSVVLFLWFFIGAVFFFSFQCVALEKYLLKYKITYNDKPLEPFLELLERERQRGWRDILKPWENR